MPQETLDRLGVALTAIAQPMSRGDQERPLDDGRAGASAAKNGPTKSAGQSLIDRFSDQTQRLQNIRVRLVQVRSAIGGGRQVEPTEGSNSPGKPRPTSYFEGMSLIGDYNDEIMEGLDRLVTEIEALF